MKRNLILDDGRELPPPDADALTWLLFHQENMVSRRQALRFMSATMLQGRLESKRWQAVHRGVYAAQTGPLTAGQRSWLAVLAVGSGRLAYLGGLSALNLMGLRGFPSDRTHVLLANRFRDHDPPPGVVVHRTGHLPTEHCLPRSAPPCTTPARSVVDAAQWAVSDNQARTIIAASFQQRLVGGDDVDRVLTRMTRASRRALIRRTAADARDGSHSLAEIDMIALCRKAGLPLPTRQARRADAARPAPLPRSLLGGLGPSRRDRRQPPHERA